MGFVSKLPEVGDKIGDYLLLSPGWSMVAAVAGELGSEALDSSGGAAAGHAWRGTDATSPMAAGADPPGAGGSSHVEVEAGLEQALGAYTLTLWDADRRAAVLRNVTFPK